MDSNSQLITNVLLVIITILTLFLNFALLVILFRIKKVVQWTPCHKLIGSIICTDVTLSFFCIISAGYHSLYGQQLLFDKPWYCQFSGSVVTILLITSISLTTAMAFNRHQVLCKDKHLSGKSLFFIIILGLALVYTAAIITAIQYDFYPVGSGTFCYPSISLNQSGKVYYGVIAVINLILPLLFTLFYIDIIKNFINGPIARAQTIIIDQEAFNYNSTHVINSDYKRPILLSPLSKGVVTKGLVYLLLYVPCWVPNLIAVGYDLFNGNITSRPPIVDCLAVISVILTTLTNPIIVFMVHGQIANELKVWIYSRA